jgi:hypothetical protein
MENVLKMYKAGQNMDYTQNAVINKLNEKIDNLTTIINTLQNPDGNNEEGGTTEESQPTPILPTYPTPPEHHRYHKDRYDAIMAMLESLQTQINELKPAPEENETGNGDETPDTTVVTEPDIQDIVNNADQNTQPDNTETNNQNENNESTNTETSNDNTSSNNETNTETTDGDNSTNP